MTCNEREKCLNSIFVLSSLLCIDMLVFGRVFFGHHPSFLIGIFPFVRDLLISIMKFERLSLILFLSPIVMKVTLYKFFTILNILDNVITYNLFPLDSML